MKDKDNSREKKRDSGYLGQEKEKKKLSDKPAPKGADRESENTPPSNEIYVNLEPDELHLADDENEIEDVTELRQKGKDTKKKK